MIGTIEEPYRLLTDIPGYTEFVDYAIGRSGTVYSFKQFRIRKLKYTTPKGKENHFRVLLRDKYKKNRIVYVRRLVAAAFLVKDDKTNGVIRLKDKSKFFDISADNLEYTKKKQIIDRYYVPKEIELSDEMIDRIKKLYDASITKGIPNLPNDVNLFLDKIMSDSMNEYISRYGLRKILTQ